MGQIVRRVDEPSVLAGEHPPQSHQSYEGDGFSVSSKLILAYRPELHLNWTVENEQVRDGTALLVFHSTVSFSSDVDPDDLNKHGNLIIETQQNGNRVLYPEEGTHYFTLLFRNKKGLLGRFFEKRSQPIRFSESIPSARVMIGRVRDSNELAVEANRRELLPVSFETEHNEAEVRRINSRKKLDAARREPEVQKPQSAARLEIVKEKEYIDGYLETIFARKQTLDELELDPRFKELDKGLQDYLRNYIKSRLDPNEMKAGRSAYGS